MHKVWDGLLIEARRPTNLPQINFDEIISSLFAAGPFYFFVIDFFDMSISHISSGFAEIHGMDSSDIGSINDILNLIHPDDMSFVVAAEKKALDFVYKNIGVEKITRYKESYNFRAKIAGENYHLFNHQSLVLTVDENGNFIKSLNILTDINHITNKNNYKFSIIGLADEPSYLNMDVYENGDKQNNRFCGNIFSKRELEIIKLLSEGNNTRSIAEKLFVAAETIKTHKKNIFKKTGCKKSAELVARSMSGGWI
ncbi:MAG: LuxR C-terminal-related transcriptional regulator [Ignavibacteriaceae bacterium]